MLPSEKRRLYVERLRQLQRLGLSMPSEYSLLDGQPSEIIVEQCGYDIESLVLDLHDGRSLYLVCLSLAAQRPGLAVYDFRFVPPWRDNEFFSYLPLRTAAAARLTFFPTTGSSRVRIF